ncbi:MAG: hypothetical protein R3F59_15525 [Myxococcota bacterium]
MAQEGARAADGLLAAIEDPARRAAIVADLARLVDEEVASKRGLSGAALRAGYAAFLKLKPGIVAMAVDHLLPDFVRAIDPTWARARNGGDGVFTDEAPAIADRMLAVTDARAARSSNRVLTKLYASLRPTAQRHVVAAVPRLPAVIRRHAG